MTIYLIMMVLMIVSFLLGAIFGAGLTLSWLRSRDDT